MNDIEYRLDMHIKEALSRGKPKEIEERLRGKFKSVDEIFFHTGYNSGKRFTKIAYNAKRPEECPLTPRDFNEIQEMFPGLEIKIYKRVF